MADIAVTFREKPAQTFNEICAKTGGAAPYVAAGLNRLALLGQLIHDLPTGVYRWRRLLPVELSVSQFAQENVETTEGRRLASQGAVKLKHDSTRPDGLRILQGTHGNTELELLLDADRRMLRGKCTCSHHFTGGLRRGPCRHLQALRMAALAPEGPSVKATIQDWFQEFSSYF